MSRWVDSPGRRPRQWWVSAQRAVAVMALVATEAREPLLEPMAVAAMAMAVAATMAAPMAAPMAAMEAAWAAERAAAREEQATPAARSRPMQAPSTSLMPSLCCNSAEIARSSTPGLRQNLGRRALRIRIARQFHALSARCH